MSYPDNVKADFSDRKVNKNVDALLAKRWSPRSFKVHKLDEEDIVTIFEAARVAPSCFNDQPWRFYISSDSTREAYLDLLVDANKKWAKNASIIGFIVANTKFSRNGKVNDYADFDCGAAWMSLTVQARALGLYTHGMGGIKHDEVRKYLDIDDDHRVICGFVIGVVDQASSLPEDFQKDESPTARRALSEILIRR